MPSRFMNPFLLIGIIGIFSIGSNFSVQIYQAFFSNHNMYWTPYQMQLPIDQTKDSFEIFINRKPIDNIQLFILNDDGEYIALQQNNITARVNNWHKVRNNILINATFSGLILGGTIAFLAIGIYQIIRDSRKDRLLGL